MTKGPKRKKKKNNIEVFETLMREEFSLSLDFEFEFGFGHIRDDLFHEQVVSLPRFDYQFEVLFGESFYPEVGMVDKYFENYLEKSKRVTKIRTDPRPFRPYCCKDIKVEQRHFIHHCRRSFIYNRYQSEFEDTTEPIHCKKRKKKLSKYLKYLNHFDNYLSELQMILKYKINKINFIKNRISNHQLKELRIIILT